MKNLILLLLTCLVTIPGIAQNPERFESEVIALYDKEYKIDPNKQVVVFTGSSSIRMWKDVQDYYPHINAINTGFGGSHFSDLNFYLSDLVFKHKPDIVFIYEGDNDIAGNKKPDEILETAKEVVSRIRDVLPSTPVYLISPKPSISRWNLEEQYVALNKLMAKYAIEDSMVTFVNVWDPMLNKEGTPMKDIFIEDNLHMNEKGYKIWGKVIGTYLE